MTECNTKPIQLSRVKRRQVSADFNGGRLTTDAGVLLLREADQKIGLIDAINDCLPDPRDPTYIIHEQREMLAQRIFSLALGYEDLNDQQSLRDDPALQIAAGKSAQEDSPLASPPTLCRLENRVNRNWLTEKSRKLITGLSAIVGHRIFDMGVHRLRERVNRVCQNIKYQRC